MKNVVQDLTSAGIDWQREKWQSGLGSKFIHQGEKNAVKYADEVIVLSKGVQDYFKETYGRETHFIQFIQVLLEANGLAAGKDHQFKGRYDAEKNAVIISLEKDEQSALSPQKCTT